MIRFFPFVLVCSIFILTGCPGQDDARPAGDGPFAQPEAVTAPDGIRPAEADERIGDPVRATIVDGVQTARIYVERGGVEPLAVKLKPGTTSELTFIRQDPDACSEPLRLPALEIETPVLPVGQEVLIEFTPTRAGVYMYHCGHERLSGRLIVQR